MPTCRVVRIMASRHSAFYSPLIAAIAGGFLEREGYEATYEVLRPGMRSHALLREGVADVIQSAPSSSWPLLERGEGDLPPHFALINRRDGFFLVSRRPDFAWRDLESATVLADHGAQPLAMLRYAAARQGVDWTRVACVDAGAPEEMAAQFLKGHGDFVHLQGPAPQVIARDGLGHVAAAVGEAMPEVAFSTLLATREFLAGETARRFLAAYSKAREWVQHTAPLLVAEAEAAFFPGVPLDALAAAIERYQEMGCWSGSHEITRELYDQALAVFGKSERHTYEDVVAS